MAQQKANLILHLHELSASSILTEIFTTGWAGRVRGYNLFEKSEILQNS